MAPVSVADRNGDNVDGLGPDQFHLFDNGKEQDIHVDVAFPPISLVIAVQANDRVESVLPQIQKIGAMIENLVSAIRARRPCWLSIRASVCCRDSLPIPPRSPRR